MTAFPRPQRVAPPALPGTLAKRPRAARQKAQDRAAREREPSHLAAIRACPCLSCGLDPACEAAHLRRQSGAHGKTGGMGKKPADRWTLPLCPACHAEQHKIGEAAFWGEIGIDPFLTARLLHAASGDLPRMRAVAFVSIAARNGGQA